MPPEAQNVLPIQPSWARAPETNLGADRHPGHSLLRSNSQSQLCPEQQRKALARRSCPLRGVFCHWTRAEQLGCQLRYRSLIPFKLARSHPTHRVGLIPQGPCLLQAQEAHAPTPAWVCGTPLWLTPCLEACGYWLASLDERSHLDPGCLG